MFSSFFVGFIKIMNLIEFKQTTKKQNVIEANDCINKRINFIILWKKKKTLKKWVLFLGNKGKGK